MAVLGFHHVGISTCDLDRSVALCRTLFGFEVVFEFQWAAGVEVVWLKPDSNMDDHRRSIDIGAELGAKNVLCVSSDPDLASTASRLAELCVHPEGCGLRVALEFGVFTEVKTLGMARAVLDLVAHPLRVLLLDPIHVDRSGGTAAEIAALPPELLPFAQAGQVAGIFRVDAADRHRHGTAWLASVRRRRSIAVADARTLPSGSRLSGHGSLVR